MNKWLFLVAGGAAGTASRYALSGAVHLVTGLGPTYGTFVVNAIGCFVIGFLSALGDEHFASSHEMKLLLIIGFCGAFTTFSSFILDSTRLIEHGHSWKAFINVTISVMAGFAVFRLGVALAQRVYP